MKVVNGAADAGEQNAERRASRVPITERPIHVYTCLTDETRSPIAMIEGWPMVFTGPTPMRVRKVADDWRREAVSMDKLIPKAKKAALLGEAPE